MRHLGTYTRLGAGLVLGGAMFAAVAWLIVSSIPLIALGISVILVGVVSLALARSMPSIPPEASAVLLQTGLENLSALVEEIGLTAPALYLPSRLTSGQCLALIPLRQNSSWPRISRPLPARLIVPYGPNPQDVGLLVRTAGSTLMQLLGARPGPSPAELEATLTDALVGRLDLGDRIHVSQEEGRVVVEIADPRLDQGDRWVSRFLGSPLASIAAAVVAEGLDKPVRIQAERWTARRVAIVLEPAG